MLCLRVPDCTTSTDGYDELLRKQSSSQDLAYHTDIVTGNGS